VSSADIRARIERLEAEITPYVPDFGMFWDYAYEMEKSMNMTLKRFIKDMGTKEDYVNKMEEAFENNH
jgi:hypothetical protein